WCPRCRPRPTGGGAAVERLLTAFASIRVARKPRVLFGRQTIFEQLTQPNRVRACLQGAHALLALPAPDELLEFLRHSALGHVHRCDRQAQLLGSFLGFLSFHGGEPEGLPSLLVKITANRVDGPGQQLPFVLFVPKALFCRRGARLPESDMP